MLLKCASSEPWFAPALIAALVAREPALANALAAVVMAGDDRAALTAAFGGADPLLAYGGAQAVASLAEAFGERLVAHGPKASVAFVGAEVDPVGTARGLARDIALFDQRGCLSVQAIYTEGDPEELAAALAWALLLESARLPQGPIDAATAAAVQQLRAEADLRQGRNKDLQLDLAVGTVLVESKTFFRPVPGLRTVRVHSVSRLTDALPAPRALERQTTGSGAHRFPPPTSWRRPSLYWAFRASPVPASCNRPTHRGRTVASTRSTSCRE